MKDELTLLGTAIVTGDTYHPDHLHQVLHSYIDTNIYINLSLTKG